MSGIKRERDGSARPKLTNDAPRGQFYDMFEGFREELDQHHDRRERIIKVSRDVTAQSKKIIFALQRLRDLNQDFPSSIQQDIAKRLEEITAMLTSIAPDLASLNRHRYGGQLRGLEELVEALTFSHYLRNQTLITPTDLESSLPDGVTLLPKDYLNGLFDLTGEMMRFATTTSAQTGALAGADDRTILTDMQVLGCEFEMLPEIPTRDFRGKMDVMRQSVRKVEKLGYGLVVRGSERPRGWVPDMKDDAPEPASP